MALEDTKVHTTELQSRCEFGKTPVSGSECPRPGEVQLDGSLLCVPHAELLRLLVQNSTLLGRVFEMDRWLDNPNNRADELHWRRVLHQRDETVEHLRSNRTLIEGHKEADQQR